MHHPMLYLILDQVNEFLYLWSLAVHQGQVYLSGDPEPYKLGSFAENTRDIVTSKLRAFHDRAYEKPSEEFDPTLEYPFHIANRTVLVEQVGPDTLALTPFITPGRRGSVTANEYQVVVGPDWSSRELYFAILSRFLFATCRPDPQVKRES